jgi:hypothetical protein
MEVDRASKQGSEERTAARSDHFAPGQNFPIQFEQGAGWAPAPIWAFRDLSQFKLRSVGCAA